MALDDTKFDATGESLDCGVCNLAGEPIEVATTSTGIPVSSCEELKTEIEKGESGSFDILQDITCGETIQIVDGQEISLASSGGDAPYRISSGRPFVGGTSASTSAEEDGGTGDDHSMFVVEKGGALDASSIMFDTKTSGTPDEGTSGNGTSSASTTTMGGGGVRAIYNAGNLTVADCEFTGPGMEATQKVNNGGAVSVTLRSYVLTRGPCWFVTLVLFRVILFATFFALFCCLAISRHAVHSPLVSIASW